MALIRGGQRVAWLALLTLLAPAAAAAESPPGEAEADSPFAATAEMRRRVRPIALMAGGTIRKVEEIVDLIFSSRKGALGFEYRRYVTLTGAEAFERRQGNCLTLVNLFVALARAAGVDARFVEVEDYEAFYRMGGVVVRSDHIVGGVYLANDLVTVDFLPGRPKRYRRLEGISDRRATAHFYKAKATEAMLGGDLEAAEALFARALDSDAEFAEVWNNYAVLLRRRSDRAGALEALERARSLDGELLPPLENLARIHRAMGRTREADEIDARILELKTRNPFYLLDLAARKLRQGELDASRSLAERARRLRPDIPEAYLVLGRVELASGNRQGATRLFEQARRKSAAYSEQFESAVQDKIGRLLSEGGS